MYPNPLIHGLSDSQIHFKARLQKEQDAMLSLRGLTLSQTVKPSTVNYNPPTLSDSQIHFNARLQKERDAMLSLRGLTLSQTGKPSTVNHNPPTLSDRQIHFKAGLQKDQDDMLSLRGLTLSQTVKPSTEQRPTAIEQSDFRKSADQFKKKLEARVPDKQQFGRRPYVPTAPTVNPMSSRYYTSNDGIRHAFSANRTIVLGSAEQHEPAIRQMHPSSPMNHEIEVFDSDKSGPSKFVEKPSRGRVSSDNQTFHMSVNYEHQKVEASGSVSCFLMNNTSAANNVQVASRIMNYQVRDVLGSGGFAIVFQAYLEIDDHEYAIKRIPLPFKEHKLNRVLREVRVLAKMNHTNIVRYYSCWRETHDQDWVCKFDQQWKQKLRDGCITESFQTPVADNTTKTDSQTKSCNSKKRSQTGISDSTDVLQTLSRGNFKTSYDNLEDSDDDLVPGMEYNFQVSSLSTSTTTSDFEESEVNVEEPDTQSSGVEVEVKNEDIATTTKKTVASMQTATDYLYIQMELCERRSLKEWLAGNTERPKQTVLKYFLDIVNAVEHVHDKRMMHRDLKPSNIFFELHNEFVVKVGDFGLGTTITEDECNKVIDNLGIPSTSANADEHTQNAGTFSYMSPEQRGIGKGTYTYKVDIFSMGLILFEMLWVMRTAQEKSRTLQDVRSKVFPKGFAEEHPDELVLLEQMLHEDPTLRLTTRGIRAQPLLSALQLPHQVDGIKQEEHFELMPDTGHQQRND